MKTPAQRPDIKAALRAVADLVLRDRADRAILLPTLVTALSVEVNDFVRYHRADYAASRVKDHEILVRHRRVRR